MQEEPRRGSTQQHIYEMSLSRREGTSRPDGTRSMQHEFDHASRRTVSHTSLRTLTSVKEKLPYLEKQFKHFDKQFEEKTQTDAKHKRNMTAEKVKTHE